MSETHGSAGTTDSAAHDGHGLVHVMPLRVLVAVFVTLAVLTYVTVSVAGIDMGVGALSLVVAMGIATVKASLVALYFMHLRYDHPFNGFVFVVGLVFLALFLSLTLLDTFQYQPEIQNWQ